MGEFFSAGSENARRGNALAPRNHLNETQGALGAEEGGEVGSSLVTSVHCVTTTLGC